MNYIAQQPEYFGQQMYPITGIQGAPGLEDLRAHCLHTLSKYNRLTSGQTKSIRNPTMVSTIPRPRLGDGPIMPEKSIPDSKSGHTKKCPFSTPATMRRAISSEDGNRFINTSMSASQFSNCFVSSGFDFCSSMNPADMKVPGNAQWIL